MDLLDRPYCNLFRFSILFPKIGHCIHLEDPYGTGGTG
jgi:hypothetical protein